MYKLVYIDKKYGRQFLEYNSIEQALQMRRQLIKYGYEDVKIVPDSTVINCTSELPTRNIFINILIVTLITITILVLV